MAKLQVEEGTVVWTRDGKQQGRTTGSTKMCTMAGCSGLRIGVRWPDNKLTWPCSRGMRIQDDGSYKIQ